MQPDKVLPKKLEDELKLGGGQRYKPRLPNMNTANLFDDSVEKALYDEIIGPLVKRPSSRSNVLPLNGAVENTKPNGISSVNSTISSTDFTTKILKRLSDVEESEKLLRKQLAELIVRNSSLERENNELRSSQKSFEKSEEMEEMLELREDNYRLVKEVSDMKQFLRDYGLEWVGYNIDSSEDYLSVENEQDSDYEEDYEFGRHQKGDEDQEHCPLAHLVRYEVFAKKIDELNHVIKSEPMQILTEGKSDYTWFHILLM
jgi:hypothetical protein